LDLHRKLSLSSFPLEGEHFVEFAFVLPRNGHGGNRVMPQLETPSVRSSGGFDL
jgi:hypothetical protein